ncbi:MAG: DUF4129 domain-containing protein [Anaerolineales bacterium]
MTQPVFDNQNSLEVAKPLRFNPWREIALFSLIIMELSFAVLWYRVLLSFWVRITYLRVFVVFGGILFISFILTRLMNYIGLKTKIQRIVLFILLIVSLWVGLNTLLYPSDWQGLWGIIVRLFNSFSNTNSYVPAEFVLMLIIIFVIWRGVSLARKRIDPERFLSSFRIGIVFLFAFGISFGLTENTSLSILYLFLFFSLLGLSVARISALGRLRGGHSIYFDRRWLIGIALAIMVILSITIIAANLVNGQELGIEIDLFGWILFVLTLLISPFVWVALYLFSALDQWIHFDRILQSLSELFIRLQSVFQGFLEILDSIKGALDFSSVINFIETLKSVRPIILWIVILLVVFLFLRSLVRYFLNESKEVEEEYQSISDQEDLLGLLRAALRKGIRRMTSGLEQVFNLDSARKFLMAARIRRVYARLLDLSDKLGNPRPLSSTPLEFLPSLENLIPNSKRELDVITQAYLRIRYGELPETQQEVEIVETAWNLVRTQGQDQLREKKRLPKM